MITTSKLKFLSPILFFIWKMLLIWTILKFYRGKELTLYSMDNHFDTLTTDSF